MKTQDSKTWLAFTFLLINACSGQHSAVVNSGVTSASTDGTTSSGSTTSGLTTSGLTTSGSTTAGATTAGAAALESLLGLGGSGSGSGSGSGNSPTVVPVGMRDVPAYFHPADASWHILGSSIVRSYGTPQGGIFPAVATWTEQGFASMAVYRLSDAKWFFAATPARNTNITANPYAYGWPAHDLPAPGNYRGDAAIELAIYRPYKDTNPSAPQDNWAHRYIAGGTIVSYGYFTDLPAPGYYDSDSFTDIAIYRPSEKRWYVKPSSGQPAYVLSIPGLQIPTGAICQPAQAHYDGLPQINLALACAVNGQLQWSVYHPSTGQLEVFNFGSAGDLVAPGPWTPGTF